MPIEYINLGEKLISNLTLELSLKELKERINDVYIDTCDAHIYSALQALDAIPFSKFPLGELNSILNNLRTACNILEKLLHKKKKVVFVIEVYELSKEERASVNKKLGSWYAAQAIVHALTTNDDITGIEGLLDKAYSFYKTSLLLSAEIRNDAGYDNYEGTQIVNDPGEWSCYHEDVYSHHNYSFKEKEEYLQSQIKEAESWDKKNRSLIKQIGSLVSS